MDVARALAALDQLTASHNAITRSLLGTDRTTDAAGPSTGPTGWTSK